jgi:proline dehydrogenase
MNPILSSVSKDTQKVAPIMFDDTSVAFSDKSNFNLKKTYFLFAAMNKQWLVKLGTFFIKLGIRLHLPIKNIIKVTIFEQFCGGESIEECQKTIQKLDQVHIGTILDYSIEGEDSETSFDKTTKEILLTIEKAKHENAIPFCVFKVTGLARLDEDERQAYARVANRVESICSLAHQLEVKIFVDAEESWIQGAIDGLAYQMMKKYNKQKAIVFNTYQLYLRDSIEKLVNDTDKATSKGYYLGAKLVRGAYMEKERLRAHEGEYCDPVNKCKADTDKDFDNAVQFCVRNLDIVAICIGTHNELSCQKLTCEMTKLHLQSNHPHIWFAQLLGMSDNISYKLAKEGYNVAKYVPYGPVEAVMPYLFRRAAENTSVAGQAGREFTMIRKELIRRKYAC